MNGTVGNPQIGQWYERTDRADLFQVTGLDEKAGTIETQSIDGDVGELDAQIWDGLPLELSQAPEDWMASAESMEAEDLACLEAEVLLENPLALEWFADAGSGHVAP